MGLRRSCCMLAIVLVWFVPPETAFAQQGKPAVAESLPSTNLSSDVRINPSLPKPAPGFANARIAANPLAPEAKSVGMKTCIACHQLEADHFTHTLHALGLIAANKFDPAIPCAKLATARVLRMRRIRKPRD